VQQKIAQVPGVGDVELGGGSLPAVRVELNPFSLNRYGVSSEDVRAALQASNANRPRGAIEGNGQRFQIYTGASTASGGRRAVDYQDLIVAWRNNAAIRLRDVADVQDGVENINTLGLFNGEPAVIVLVTRQPAANVIETVDGVRDLLPELQAQLPQDVRLQVASDSTNSIRASLKEIEITLIISIVLVVLVVSAFLRSARATIIPAVATVVSLLGTFGVMYLMGFSLNNLSLMALTVATGFVVDDAIVVLENTSRHIEAGMDRFKAALLGAREVGFTVLSISLSLVAVFIPLLFMGGQIGRLFREFAVTLSAAVLISLLISLTTTPMMCAWLLKPDAHTKPSGRIARWFDAAFQRVHRSYETSLDWALHSKLLVMLILAAVVGLNVYLYVKAPKGFLPAAGHRPDQRRPARRPQHFLPGHAGQAQAAGRHHPRRPGGGHRGRLYRRLARGRRLHVHQPQARGPAQGWRPGRDRAPAAAAGAGDGREPLPQHRAGPARRRAPDQLDLPVHAQERQRGRPEPLGHAPGRADEDPGSADRRRHRPAGKRRGNHGHRRQGKRRAPGHQLARRGQRALQRLRPAPGRDDLRRAQPVPRDHGGGAALYAQPRVAQGHLCAGQKCRWRRCEHCQHQYDYYRLLFVHHRDHGCVRHIGNHDNQQRHRQQHPHHQRQPGPARFLERQCAEHRATTMVPLSAIARFSENPTAASISHEDGELSTTISYNLADGSTLSDGEAAVRQAEADIRLPTNVRGSFSGTARSAQESQGQQPLLILAALVVIYIVLGILYESLIHPITVLSTLPSAGVGAVLALLMFKLDFSIIALIGVFLLIGIVKKNAILIIDFALEAERARGIPATEAVREACLLRFRPILMTTLAAILGALPLAIGFGEGAELRRPLGIAIIGGLIASQLLTLLTTPVVYVLMDKLRRRSPLERQLSRHPGENDAAPPNAPLQAQ
jgi:multidrug efflux pump subunit AcrB